MNRIIQCPACNTKFALNETQLSGLDNPKFHCSRCNTVFTLQTHENPIKDHSKEEVIQTEKEDKNDADSHGKEIHSSKEVSRSEETMGSDSETSTKDYSDLDVDSENLDQEIDSNENPTLEDEGNIDTTEDHDSLKNVNNDWNMGESGSADKKMYEEDKTEDSLTSFNTLHFDREEDHEDEIDDSQLSLFPKDILDEDNNIEPGIFFVEETSDIDEIEGIKVSWESSNPDVPHEVDLGKRKNLSEPFDTKETKVLSRSALNEEVEKIEPLEPHSPQEEIAPKSLNDLFKRESRKNKDPVHVTGTHSKIENTEATEHNDEKDEEEEIPSALSDDIPLQSITPKYSEDISSTANRSMKHTTIVKRDELEISGFVDDDEFEDDEFHEAPQILRKDTYKTKSSFPKFSLSIPSLPHLVLTEAYRSYILAWSLPFIFMTVLVIWSYQLSDSPFSKAKETNLGSRIGKILGLDAPLPMKMPPQGVSFSPVYAYQSLSKNNRTAWLILTGYALNSSNTPISSMEIVTIFYDEDQNLVSKETSFIPNSLAEVNFNSFTDQEIAEKSIIETNMVINQSTSKIVMLAIKDNPKAKWFALRVYSTSL